MRAISRIQRLLRRHFSFTNSGKRLPHQDGNPQASTAFIVGRIHTDGPLSVSSYCGEQGRLQKLADWTCTRHLDVGGNTYAINSGSMVTWSECKSNILRPSQQ
jgi:hypothetical protein